MKRLILLVLFLFVFLFTPENTYAINNPLDTPNNKFGIHVASMSDLRDAQNLVNSSGGDWGYVTFVIQDNDKNKDYWQYIFNEMRKMHLIPILRIATHAEKDYWVIPSKSDIDSWAKFLNSLNWVVENRYVIIGNEPNHAKEWGNTINPEDYSDYLVAFSQALKNENEDFFVLPAGLDLSAANTKHTMDAENYLVRIYKHNPQFFNSIDGWTSHSYPNPDFTGSVFDTGRKSVQGFIWEESFLKTLGITKDYPIFITETGWAKYSNKNSRYTKLLSEDLISGYYKDAFSKIWVRDNIVTVTPFLLNYQQPPFNVFSWKGDLGYYSYYETVRSLSKTKGEPLVRENIKVRANYVFPFPDKNNNYKGVLIVENTGQSIIQKTDLALKAADGLSSILTSATFSELEPFSTGAISYSLHVTNKETELFSFVIYKQGKYLSESIEVKLNTLKTVEMKLEWFFAKIRTLLGL